MTPGRRKLALAAAAAIGAAAWVALAFDSPNLYGWVYDPYYQGVVWSYEHGGRPPPAEACWVCAHPPLFFMAGAPLYALGKALTHHPGRALRALSVLSLLSAAAVVLATDRLLRLFRFRGAERAVGTGLALTLPCLAFAAGGPEADVLVAGLVAVLSWLLARYVVRGERATWRDAAAMGGLCGLALLTKYSAFAALLAVAATVGALLLVGPSRRRRAGHLLLVVALPLAIASWRYADNWRRHGALLHANGSAREGFLLRRDASHASSWDFARFSIGPVLDLWRPGSEARMLNDEPVYREVWTTLHAQAWTDMSFFSVRGRYGGGEYQPYRTRRTFVPLAALALVAGLYPTALAAIGAAALVRRRAARPLLLLAALAGASYLWWVVGQEHWALKTKYLLFLVPTWALCALAGLRALASHLPPPAPAAALGALAAVALAAEAYLWMFIVT